MRLKAIKKNGRRDVNRDLIRTYLSRWKDGTPFTIEILRKQKKVSDPQRKMYFAGVLPPFMEHLGYEPTDKVLFHNQMKALYFQIKPDKYGMYKNLPSVFGNDSEIPVSDKTKFIEFVLRQAAYEGVYIEMDERAA